MTRLIVISSEKDIPGEPGLVNELFENGMELFHLRKPHWSAPEQENFLREINPRFIRQISLHQHHAHVNDFDLHYMHFNGKNTASISLAENIALHAKQHPGLKTSFSFHSYEEIEKYNGIVEYGFLSPVFDSISKTGYTQQINPALTISSAITTNIFGLGGVTENNAHLLLQRGFYGAAVLGAVWNDPSLAVNEFKKIKKACSTNVHTY